MPRLLFFAAVLCFASAALAEEPPLTVDAAASLVDVLPKIAQAWSGQGGTAIRFDFDATSRLAAQVKAGAKVDVFFSADVAWMDALAKDGLLEPGSRTDLLENELVLVAPPGSPVKSLDGVADAAVKKVAVAGENVPAGRYARAALQSLGLWNAVSRKLVNAPNVRQALLLATSGEVDAAIVYRTDARTASWTFSAAFPAGSHPRIVYPAAVLVKARPEAARFLAFCRSPAARDIFEAAGFRVLAKAD